MKGLFSGGYTSGDFSRELWRHLLESMCDVDESLKGHQLERIRLGRFVKDNTGVAVAEGCLDGNIVTVWTRKNESGRFGYHVSSRVIINDEQVFDGEFSWEGDRYYYNGTIDEAYYLEDEPEPDEAA